MVKKDIFIEYTDEREETFFNASFQLDNLMKFILIIQGDDHFYRNLSLIRAINITPFKEEKVA